MPESSEEPKALSCVDSVDPDSRFSKDDVKKEAQQDADNPSTSSCKLAHPARPIPDGDFEFVLFWDDPNRGVKIGAGLPDIARKQLKACLRENADLFAWSASEMPGLDPNVACHQLTIDPAVRAVAQRR